MRGISATLWIVIAIVVFIVAALVIVTIFSGGVQQVSSITQASALCQQTCQASCSATGNPPVTWRAPTVIINNEPSSCYDVTGGDCTC